MKTIRSLMTLAGLTLAVFALSATGAKAQAISAASFSGTFTLPVAAQWGRMTLPAGTYNLNYGWTQGSDVPMLEVTGKAKGSPHGFIIAQTHSGVSVAKNTLLCVREGDALVIRALEMPAIGTAVKFSMPHGARLVAQNTKHNGYAQLAEAPMLIERVPVTLNTK